MILYLNKIPV